jgi:nucleotide sugar dehydrogenase
VLPIVEKTGFRVGKDFFLAHCPERIDPGNRHYDVSNIPRVLGGVTEKCLSKAYDFYKAIIDADIVRLSSVKAAEATKMVENIFRDVNIAMVNELAMSFDVMDIDITEVIKGASTKPFAFMPHYPGCGVGGHCIPIDPYYLIERARENGFVHRFLSLARDINKRMPDYTMKRLLDGLMSLGKNIREAKIAVLGLAYKPDVDDTRESPAFDIISELEKLDANFDIYDPFVADKSTAKNLDEALSGKDCAVLVTAHTEFKKMTADKLNENGIGLVIDGRNFLDKDSIKKAGIIYLGIGR